MDITAEVLDSKIENSFGTCKVHAVLRMCTLPIPHINLRLLAAGVIPSPPPPPLRSEPLRGMAYAPLLGILDMALQKKVDAAIALKIERCPKLGFRPRLPCHSGSCKEQLPNNDIMQSLVLRTRSGRLY